MRLISESLTPSSRASVELLSVDARRVADLLPRQHSTRVALGDRAQHRFELVGGQEANVGIGVTGDRLVDETTRVLDYPALA